MSPSDLQLHTKTEFIPVGKIVKNDWNPNFVSESLMRAIKDDIEKNGFIGTIVVQKHNSRMDKDNVIINGEHRFKALTELGIDIIPSIVLDVDDATAKILTIRLNREHGELMPDKLVTVLQQLNPEFDLDELNRLTAIDKRELEILSALDLTNAELLEDITEEESTTKPSWLVIERWLRALADKIANVYDGGILAVTTGGIVPAALLARELNITDIKLLPITRRHVDTTVFQQSPPLLERAKTYLVVDDIYDTGQTFENISQSLTELAPESIFQYAFLTVRAKSFETAKENKDLSFGKVISHDNYVLFPWELAK